jgi:hypothetical protein
MTGNSPAEPKRWPIYRLLIVIALAIAAGRIAVVKSQEGDTAFLSANDRSRWATVASLGERGTYAIDQQIAITNPIHRNRRPWDSIDKVRHLGRDGKQHYYSSKPPLLATVVAGLYKLVAMTSGMTLTEQPIYVARILLALVNLPLLALFLSTTIASMDRLVRSDWAGMVSAAACCFATMVFPFVVSLNNHLPAAAATALVMWVYIRAARGGAGDGVEVSRFRFFRNPTREPREVDLDSSPADTSGETAEHRQFGPLWAGLAGVAAASAAANELPALSMLVFWFLLFAWLDRASILPFAAGAVIVAAAFFGTNWIAHQSLRPPYAHRGDGALIGEFTSEADVPDDGFRAEIRRQLSEGSVEPPSSTLAIDASDEAGRWVVRNGERQFALVKDGDRWQLRHWDDWYEYPGTYWKEGTRRGVDRGESSRLTYLFHMTFGHHGLFSLTPIWLLMPIGLLIGVRADPPAMKRYTAAVLVASLVCFLFYLNRPLIDRNYGGVSICFRWLLWFAPLWLVAIAPVIDRSAVGRVRPAMVLVLLACSVFSVFASLQTPWQSPWLYQFWSFLGWISG